MNDEINRSDIITGIAGMIDTRVAECVGETSRNTRWIKRVEERVVLNHRDESDAMKQAVQTNAESIDALENSMNAQITEVISNLNGQHVNTDIEDRLTAIEERLDNLVDALQTLSSVE